MVLPRTGLYFLGLFVFHETVYLLVAFHKFTTNNNMLFPFAGVKHFKLCAKMCWQYTFCVSTAVFKMLFQTAAFYCMISIWENDLNQSFDGCFDYYIFTYRPDASFNELTVIIPTRPTNSNLIIISPTNKKKVWSY